MSRVKIAMFSVYSAVLALLVIFFLSSCESEIPEIEFVKVTGKVQEISSTQPIPGVNVSIVDQEDIDAQISGNDGSFTFDGLRLDDGTYALETTSDDYIDERVVFTIDNGKLLDTIVVSLIASEVLDFDQQILDFGSGIEEIDLRISNTSSSTQSVSISSEADWLSSSDSETVIGSGGNETITFTVDREDADVGSFEESVIFEVEGRPSQSITVKMQKLDPNSGILTLNTTNLDFGKASENQPITVSNTGQSTLNWTASSADTWYPLLAPAGLSNPEAILCWMSRLIGRVYKQVIMNRPSVLPVMEVQPRSQ
ncbi:MAG: carboxypeptidase regulatory-like domain-containing protein [Ekhidna sp.]|nr:carboxypeptidase regulatory-like domain-containing protein [Ekhidna sp.]